MPRQIDPKPPSPISSASARPPTVSVILPAFNASRFLRETLQSALAQTLTDFEVVAVDDGSTDGTSRILDEFAAQEPRVRIFRQQNAGVAAARNLAISKARGRYLAPLDADDLWHPEYLRLAVEALEVGGPDCALAYAWWVPVDENGALLGSTAPSYAVNQHAGRHHVVTTILKHNFVGPASAAVMRRDKVVMVGGYDPSLHARRRGM